MRAGEDAADPVGVNIGAVVVEGDGRRQPTVDVDLDGSAGFSGGVDPADEEDVAVAPLDRGDRYDEGGLYGSTAAGSPCSGSTTVDLLLPAVRGIGDFCEVVDALLVGGGIDLVMLGDPDRCGLSPCVGGESLPHLLPEGLALVDDGHVLLVVAPDLDLEALEGIEPPGIV